MSVGLWSDYSGDTMGYSGTIDYKTMPKDVRQGYVSWRRQRDRCLNHRRQDYKYYGAKNVQVKYGSRDFINWWLEQLTSFVGRIPTVSRRDHDGDYEFGNIKMEDLSENVSERNRRRGNPTPPKTIYCKDIVSGKTMTFKSTKEADRKLGVKGSSRGCTRGSLISKRYKFSYTKGANFGAS